MSPVLLIAGVLLATPPEPAGQLPLRLEVGQELVYRGYFTETSARVGLRSSRKCDLETFVLVLNQAGSSYDVALLTVQRPERKAAEEPIVAARLEVGRVDALGRLRFPTTRPRPPTVPMEGPPSLETAGLLERPAALAGGMKWEDRDENQPGLNWTLSGLTRYETHECLLMTGRQAGGEWLREDRVWVRRDGGFALRIERKIEQRGGEFSSQMVVELASCHPFTLTPSEISNRRIEINQARTFATTLDELLQPRGEPDRRAYEDLLESIDLHIKNRGRTPYREAILDLRRRTLLARSGERPPEPVIVLTHHDSTPADEGQPAPDFTAADLLTGDALRLSQLKGKPVVLVFFRPTAASAKHLLAYADEAARLYAGRAAVLPLPVDGQPGAVIELRTALKVRVPVYGGAEALKLFAGTSTPRVVIIDKAGTIRTIASGWGGEYPDWFRKEMEKLTP